MKAFAKARKLKIAYQDCTMERNAEGKKIICAVDGTELGMHKALPPQWTQKWGDHRTEVHTPLQGLICGTLRNKEEAELEIIALDCDDLNSWVLFNALNPEYLCQSQSIGKPGGTIFYSLPKALYSLKQYSIKNSAMAFEYMAQRESGPNAMVFLPTEANHTKENIPPHAELTEPPQSVISLLLSLKQPLPACTPVATPSLTAQPHQAPLLTKYVNEIYTANTYIKLQSVSPVASKLYKIITPRKFRHEEYREKGYLHPDDSALLKYGSWSEYIVGVSAIVGSDASVSPELYVQLMQAIVAQTSDPMQPKRLMTEVINPMVQGKSRINNTPLWKYDEKWDQQSLQVINQYGEPLEYYTLEDRANTFLEYNTVTAATVIIAGTRAVRDHIYTRDSDPAHQMPAAELVTHLKLIQIRDNIRLPIGLSSDNNSHGILNTAKPTLPLQVLRDPDSFAFHVDVKSVEIQAFDIFISHLLNEDSIAITFLKQLIAYHGRHLKPISVILYMVGPGGAGKSIFASLLECIFGVNTTRRPSAKQCASNFNDFLDNTVLLILTETSDSSPREQSALKSVLKTVTGETHIDVEAKGVPLRAGVELCALPLLLANEPWYTEDTADRRLFSIMPRTTMIESKPIAMFERAHGVRIVDIVLKTAKSGLLSKYISSFCPDILSEVPLTLDKKLLSAEQKNPIMVVKNLVATGDWFHLFDLFQQYNVSTFFTAMEAKWLRDKNALFKQQLVDLVEGAREGMPYPSDAEISKAFTIRFLPRVASQYRPIKPAAKKLGYIKWHVPIAQEYEKWKVQCLKDF